MRNLKKSVFRLSSEAGQMTLVPDEAMVGMYQERYHGYQLSNLPYHSDVDNVKYQSCVGFKSMKKNKKEKFKKNF